MRAIGFWIESLHDTSRIPPQELVRPLPDDVRRAVSDYLDRGDVFESYRGYSWCRFFCDHPMGSRELSDGRWFWPEGLSHYVRDHGVTLPEDFIDHVLSGTPRIPRSEWVPSGHDHGDWERWCRENASEAYWQRLEQARQAADVQNRRELASAVTVEAYDLRGLLEMYPATVSSAEMCPATASSAEMYPATASSGSWWRRAWRAWRRRR